MVRSPEPVKTKSPSSSTLILRRWIASQQPAAPNLSTAMKDRNLGAVSGTAPSK
jgi:hypothetical protein